MITKTAPWGPKQGADLKAQRVQARLTQRQVAAWASVPLRTYQDYEQGRTGPSGPRLMNILTALHLYGRDKNEVPA